MSYPIHVRERVLNFVKDTGNKREAARKFKISLFTIYKWLAPRTTPRPRGAYRLDRGRLTMLVREQPEATRAELAAALNVSISTVAYNLKKLGICCVKRHELIESNQLDKPETGAGRLPFLREGYVQ